MRIRDLQEFIGDPATTQVEIDTSQVMIDTCTVKLKDAINTARQGKYGVPVREAVTQRTASWVGPNATAYSPEDDDTIMGNAREDGSPPPKRKVEEVQVDIDESDTAGFTILTEDEQVLT